MVSQVKNLAFFPLLFVMFACIGQKNPNAFVTIWNTRNEGLGDSTQVVLPLRGHYTVNWMEVGNPDNTGTLKGCVDNVVIKFDKPGKYRIEAYGEISTMNFEAYTIDTIPMYGAMNYKLLSVERWGGVEWTSFDSFFFRCVDVSINTNDAPNLSKVTSCRQLFCDARNFNGKIGHWDMSHVQDMSYMFYGAHKFNQNIGDWNVGNARTMHSMFYNAYVFNQPIGGWSVGHVTDMSGMFDGASSFNQPLGDWNVKNVSNMTLMFSGATVFNQPLNGWDVSMVDDMAMMFSDAYAFNQPLNKWNVSRIHKQGFEGMFDGALKFNQPLNDWNVSNITILTSMFYRAESFNQSLDQWKITKDCILSYVDPTAGERIGLFTGSNMSRENLEKTLNAWGQRDIVGLFLRDKRK